MSAESDLVACPVTDLMREQKTPVIVGIDPEDLSELVLSIKYDKRNTYQYGGYHRISQVRITLEQAEQLLQKLVVAINYALGEEDE